MNDLEYRTRNLAYASFLLANGAQIPEIRGEQGRAEFVFLDEERALGWQWELFKADAPVPIQQYLCAERDSRTDGPQIWQTQVTQYPAEGWNPRRGPFSREGKVI